MRHLHTILIIAFASTLGVKAQVVQHVLLKNGTTLEGYISESSTSTITFHSERAEVVLDGVNTTISTSNVLETSLDTAWQSWAERNDVYDGIAPTRTLALSTININGSLDAIDSVVNGKTKSNAKPLSFTQRMLISKRVINNVRVVEQGQRVRYIQMQPDTYDFTWKDVVAIRIPRRPRNLLSGINVTYVMRDGNSENKYEGQPAGESENTISLYLKDTGVEQTLNIDDVVKYTYSANNPNQDLLQQCQLLDVVSTTLGTVTGLIIEQNYSGKDDSQNYILVYRGPGDIQSVKMSDYLGVQHKKNENYNPVTDVIVKAGEVLVNRKPMLSVGVKEYGFNLILDSLQMDNKLYFSECNGKLIVEYPATEGAKFVRYRLVPLNSIKVKRMTCYGFNYKDLSSATYSYSNVETSINQTTRVEYNINKTGGYALYDEQFQTAIPILIYK